LNRLWIIARRQRIRLLESHLAGDVDVEEVYLRDGINRVSGTNTSTCSNKWSLPPVSIRNLKHVMVSNTVPSGTWRPGNLPGWKRHTCCTSFRRRFLESNPRSREASGPWPPRTAR
jgi:hypothetical protein